MQPLYSNYLVRQQYKHFYTISFLRLPSLFLVDLPAPWCASLTVRDMRIYFLLCTLLVYSEIYSLEGTKLTLSLKIYIMHNLVQGNGNKSSGKEIIMLFLVSLFFHLLLLCQELDFQVLHYGQSQSVVLITCSPLDSDAFLLTSVQLKY